MDDNFDFSLIPEFSHYISSRDKTNVTPTALIKNSKNVYKKRSGNIANRPGLKVRGALNAAAAGVVSSFEWETSLNVTRPIRVTSNGTLSVEYDASNGMGPIWYDLLTGLTLTRFIFDGSYTDLTQIKRLLLAVNGSIRQIYNWEGGITVVGSAGAPVAGVITQGYGIGFSANTDGSGYQVGDILTLTGGDGTAKVTVSQIDGTGRPTRFNQFIVPQGSGYSVNGSNPTTGGSGTGATVNIMSVYSGGTLTKADTSTTFFEDGFSKNTGNPNQQWKFKYNGVEYSYSGGLDSTKLTGIIPDPSGIPAGAVIISPFIAVPNIPFSGTSSDLAFSYVRQFAVDFLKVINNQLYIGSYGFNVIFVADQSDYGNFTVVANGGLGTPFIMALDNNAVGIGVRTFADTHTSIPYIFGGTSSIYQVNITTQVIPQGSTDPAITVQVVGIVNINLGENAAPLSQEFIYSDFSNLIWLDQENQLRIYGAVNNVFLSDKAPLLSQPVYEELQDIDFTGGALRVIGEFVYITAPLIGTHYMYQTREYVDESGGSRSEKIWNPPQISGISRFANIQGVVYGHSNINPMIYQVWNTDQWFDDSPSGEPIAYECVIAMAYRQISAKGSHDRRQGKLRFDKIYFEGYMARGSLLYGKVLYEYQGSDDIKMIQINTVTKPAKLFTYANCPSLGTDTLGDNPLGTGIQPSVNEQDYLPKFKAIRKVKMENCSEYAIEIFSYDIDARWEIITAGANQMLSPEVPRDLLA